MRGQPLSGYATTGRVNMWQLVFWAGSLLLLLRIALLAVDPRASTVMGGNDSLWSVITVDPLAMLVDMVYAATNWLIWPLLALTELIQRITADPTFGDSLPASSYLDTFLHNPRQAMQWAPGVVDRVTIVTLLLWQVLGVVVPAVIRGLKATYWHWWTEWRYQQERQSNAETELRQQQQALLAMSRNLTAMQDSAATLYRQNVTDHLTQLYNKRFFTQKLQDVVQVATTDPALSGMAGLMMLDIDHFKKLNDRYGHAMGDQVLAAVAQVIKECTPKGAFACRYGGEEFGIIFARHSVAQMQLAADQIRQQVVALHWESLPELTTSVSQGLAQPSVLVNTPAALLEAADQALYAAKQAGRNQLSVYAPASAKAE